MSPVTASSSSIHNATASTTTVMISSSEWHDEDYDILAEALFDEAPTAECLTTVPVATVHATSSSAPPVPATTSESTTTVTTIATSASPASPRSVAIVSPVSSSCDLTQSSTPPPVNHTHKKKKKQPTKKTTQPDSTVATKKQRVSSQGSSVSTATATASTLKHKKASPVKPTSTPSPSTQAPASSSSSSASSRSTPATPPQPPSRGIPKQPSLALTQFLKAVSVTNQEAATTPNTKKQRVSSQGSSVPTATAASSTLKHKKASSVKPTSPPSPSTKASASSSASSRSTLPSTPPQPPSRGIPKQPSLALTQFLKAVSVTNQEARQHQKQSTLALGDMTPAEQVEFRRERNRCLAKQTRQRKKVQMTALKQQLQVLYQEHLKLHAICVQQQIVDVQDDDEQEAPLTSPGLDKIPKAVWDATGIAHAGATDDDDDEDDDLEDNVSDDGSEAPIGVAPQSLTPAPAESSVPLLEEPVVPTPAPSSSSMTPLPVEQDESALLPPLTVPHPQPDEDSMLLMTILKDHHDTDDIVDHDEAPVASSAETTTTTCLPPLSMITDDDASSQSGSSVATTTGVPTSSSSMEDPMVMPEFSIPNPLAALAHVPETTAPATTTTMSLFGKPVVLSASSSK
eukprot:CAMPEP_0172472154 /NCGR_PEP_ID=MMETSP1065-20121228/68189_1 /TAXON_ID=265537 /ORGANISM="Amphiprora paludosa, Strain CCMP125" /LENGTH=628 /DNA_ID=CAMNT_0013230283 /DNA_START=30 /DNA_END=1915 /DNA_ORIENTATION=+